MAKIISSASTTVHADDDFDIDFGDASTSIFGTTISPTRDGNG